MTVKVYSTPSCPYCHKAKDYLKEKGVEFEDINVAEDTNQQQEMIKLSGQMGVPVIAIGEEVIVGFDQAKMDEALAS